MDKPVLYRCQAPTNYLCACGRVARALDSAGVEYETRRVPLSRKKRPEVIELTAQDRVPVLVDGKEVIHESHRVTEYIKHKWETR